MAQPARSAWAVCAAIIFAVACKQDPPKPRARTLEEICYGRCPTARELEQVVMNHYREAVRNHQRGAYGVANCKEGGVRFDDRGQDSCGMSWRTDATGRVVGVEVGCKGKSEWVGTNLPCTELSSHDLTTQLAVEVLSDAGT